MGLEILRTCVDVCWYYDSVNNISVTYGRYINDLERLYAMECRNKFETRMGDKVICTLESKRCIHLNLLFQ